MNAPAVCSWSLRPQSPSDLVEKVLADLQPVREDKSPEAVKVPDESKGIDWGVLAPA
jgi:hypothetical protein